MSYWEETVRSSLVREHRGTDVHLRYRGNRWGWSRGPRYGDSAGYWLWDAERGCHVRDSELGIARQLGSDEEARNFIAALKEVWVD